MNPTAIVIIYLVAASIVVGLGKAFMLYQNYRSLLHQSCTLLELAPPSFSQKAPEATEEFFGMLHSLLATTDFKERLLGRRSVLSCEVVSSREQGIRFMVRLPSSYVTNFTQQLTAYLPDVHFQIVDDYMPATTTAVTTVMEFKQAGHYSYPLADHYSLKQHDPIAYVAGAMTRLRAGELIAFQLVITPRSTRPVRGVPPSLARGRQSQHQPLLLRLLQLIISLPFKLLAILFGLITELTSPTDKVMRHYQPPVKAAPLPVVTPAARPPIGSAPEDKLAQPLFQTTIRAVVMTTSRTRVQTTSRGMSAALASFRVPGYQALIVKPRFPNRLTFHSRWYGFQHRLPALRQGTILSVSEMASLYHFPYGDTAKPENIKTSYSRTLPASAALKQAADRGELDVILGVNNHHGSKTPIGLTAAERERHVYVIGGTGNGKTTLLHYGIVQDIQQGKGVAVIDPHGDLAESLLRNIPESRLNDVIYFNPADIDHPLGLNLLELPPGLSKYEELMQKDLLTESVISIFRKAFSDDESGGHRIEYILRNAIQTALTVPGATIFTVFRLLTSSAYRSSVASKLTDPDLKNFWFNEFNRAGDFQRVKMGAGVTSKVGRFLFSVPARRVLEQPKSTINFDDILQSGKILICNFSKGLLGEDTSSLFGVMVLAKLQLASLRRARLPQAERRPFYLYVDEFQTFASVPFVQMLSEARKYKLFLTMAEQSPSQQERRRLTSLILANVGTVVTFRSGSPLDEDLILPLFAPHVEKGEILQLEPYNFYVRLSAGRTREPLSGATLLLKHAGSDDVAEAVKLASSKHYATAYKAPAPVPTTQRSPTSPSSVVGPRYTRV